MCKVDFLAYLICNRALIGALGIGRNPLALILPLLLQARPMRRKTNHAMYIVSL